MTKRLYFENINSINDFVNVIVTDEENINYLLKNGLDNNIIDKYIYAVKKIPEVGVEEEFIYFIHYVDKKMNFAGEHNQNRNSKIPTIFSYANLLCNYYEKIKIYNLPQKLALSKHLFNGTNEELEDLNDNYPKELMDVITKKYNNYSYHIECLRFCDWNKDKMSVEEIIDFINSNKMTDIMDSNRKSINEYLIKYELEEGKALF